MNELVEKLAHYEHASWARWMVYLFSICDRQPDGSVRIPPGLVERWMRQATTDYADLTEREKQSDREEVAHILPLIVPVAEHAALERERDTYKGDRDHFMRLCQEQLQRTERVERERDALNEAATDLIQWLGEYGRHRRGCAFTDHNVECDCGYADVVSTLLVVEGSVEPFDDTPKWATWMHQQITSLNGASVVNTGAGKPDYEATHD